MRLWPLASARNALGCTRYWPRSSPGPISAAGEKKRVRLVGLREVRGIHQLHAGGDFQAAGAADHHQARHTGLARGGSQLCGHLAAAADVIARARAVGAGQHVVAGDGGNQRIRVIQRSDHRMGAGQLGRKILRAAHDDGEFVAVGQRVAGDLAADVAGGTNEGDLHGRTPWGGGGWEWGHSRPLQSLEKQRITRLFVAWIEHMDRLTAMTVFVEVAERGSLTAAAEVLDMSRAMVSRYLAEVEGWLGARLLHRTTRRVSLTGPGEAALARFRQMLEIGEALQGELASDDPEPHGTLRVTASVSFGQSHLARAVAGFVARHPAARIELLLVDRTVNLVEERVDLAVRIARQIDPSLIARRLATCRSVLCATPSYLQAHGTPTAPEHLAAHNCLTHHYVGKSLWQLHRDGRSLSVAVGGNISANEASLLLEAVRAGAVAS
ncbi:hypothetical protein G6F57_015024 [Rhizopus arrhizus]|nr:hypothetical protein G6F57_015024 [Rhizopus arrhizus]